jgi:ubiquinone/menaquinone biosynthesis C-methylase UbiE
MHRYNETAEMYDGRYCAEQEAKYKAALDSVKLTAGSMVLDLGCGTGLFFTHLADVACAVGVDVSKQLLLQAQQRAKTVGNVGVVLADADHLPFIPATFSPIFAFTVLQNMPKPAKTLAETIQAAKSDAHFVLTALKRAISLDVFGELLEAADLTAIALRDDEGLQCFVVTAIHKTQ